MANSQSEANTKKLTLDAGPVKFLPIGGSYLTLVPLDVPELEDRETIYAYCSVKMQAGIPVLNARYAWRFDHPQELGSYAMLIAEYAEPEELHCFRVNLFLGRISYETKLPEYTSEAVYKALDRARKVLADWAPDFFADKDLSKPEFPGDDSSGECYELAGHLTELGFDTWADAASLMKLFFGGSKDDGPGDIPFE